MSKSIVNLSSVYWLELPGYINLTHLEIMKRKATKDVGVGSLLLSLSPWL